MVERHQMMAVGEQGRPGPHGQDEQRRPIGQARAAAPQPAPGFREDAVRDEDVQIAPQRQGQRRQGRKDVDRPFAPRGGEKRQRPDGGEEEEAEGGRPSRRRPPRSPGEEDEEAGQEQAPRQHAEHQRRQMEPYRLRVIERRHEADDVVSPEEGDEEVRLRSADRGKPRPGHCGDDGQIGGPAAQADAGRTSIQERIRRRRHEDQHKGDRPLGQDAERTRRRRQQPPAHAKPSADQRRMGRRQPSRGPQTQQAVHRQLPLQVNEPSRQAQHDRPE